LEGGLSDIRKFIIDSTFTGQEKINGKDFL
jgi:hypothetical protein